MRIGYLGSGNLGEICLDQIISKFDLQFVLTDNKSDNIIEKCKERGILYYCGNPRKGRAIESIGDQEIDVLLSVNYLYFIERDLIELPKLYPINLHGSLLPKYRGRTPHVWAIINNEKETGVTAHLIDDGLDTGDIIDQVEVEIGPYETGTDILKKFNKIYPEFIVNILSKIEKGRLIATPQDSSKATFFGKRTPDDGRINWDWQKERILNWVRAISNPYPGAFTFIRDKKVIIDSISFSDLGFSYEMPNGLILSSDPLVVKTPNGAVQVDRLRNDNINMIPGEKFE